MVWKKNSVAVSPEKKELGTKPRAAGKRDSGRKWGRVRLTKPFSMRLPPTDCWPRMAIIWEMLMSEPLDPHSVMIRGALCQGSFCKASSPHLRRIPPRTEFSSDSKDCNELQPGFKGSFPVS